MYKLTKNLEETDRKDLIWRRKGEAKNLKGHKKKLQKGIYLNDTKKVQFSQKKYRLEILVMNLRKRFTIPAI